MLIQAFGFTRDCSMTQSEQAHKRVDGFFYGLFMDAAILQDSGINAEKPRHAYVDGYQLVIGNRATLVPSPGARAYGMIFALAHHDLDQLYGAPGLEHYQPEAVLAQSLDGQCFPALCYNLLDPPCPGEENPLYAGKLRAALTKLEFPSDYIASV